MESKNMKSELKPVNGVQQRLLLTVVVGGIYVLLATTIALAETSTYNDHSGTASEPRARYQRDNSGVNVRDRNSKAITADEQKNNDSAIETTRKIRQAVVAKEELSTYAHNVKIITDQKGMVTLRGPVRSTAEKQEIERIAADIAGSSNVRNELEIAPAKK